jgi:hypothetical protein
MMFISFKTFFVIFKLEIYFKGKVVILLKKTHPSYNFQLVELKSLLRESNLENYYNTQ